MPQMKVVPLGAGQEVGRSCILVTFSNGKQVMLDCGMHMGFSDERRFPDFSFIGKGDLTEKLDCVIISHFHLDHCGALPHMTEVVGYNGPVYMTYPTKAIVPILLEDYRKIQTEHKGDSNFYTSAHIKACMGKVIAVNLHEVIHVDEEMTIQAFYAGHVLGAAMFLIRVGSESVLYTGDFNMTPDRHLGAAKVPAGLCPDLLITETTYASTIRDSKRARERDFLKKVHETVVNTGGKVLIPVFALGRAQELFILLESYWERLDLKVPIYFSAGLAQKATQYYRLFINWTNEKIKKTFVAEDENVFEFKRIQPFDRAYADNPGPMVLFSTPGMLHGGQSLQMFKKWCGDDRNMIIMPGYCVSGTVGAKVIAGAKEIDIYGQKVQIRMKVEYMSFSAHADAKGIMQLIKNVDPHNVMFVHGEKGKMEVLKSRVEKEFNVKVFMPANAETISVDTMMNHVWKVPRQLITDSVARCASPSKKSCPLQAFGVVDDNEITELITKEDAVERFGKKLHAISFSDIVKVENLDWEMVADKLRRYDSDLQLKMDGIEMFNGEVLLLRVPGEKTRIELVWDETRETWISLVMDRISAERALLQRSQHRVEEGYK